MTTAPKPVASRIIDDGSGTPGGGGSWGRPARAPTFPVVNPLFFGIPISDAKKTPPVLATKSLVDNPVGLVTSKDRGPKKFGALEPLPKIHGDVQEIDDVKLGNGDGESLPPRLNPVVKVPGTIEKDLSILKSSALPAPVNAKTLPGVSVSVTITVSASTECRVSVAKIPVPQQLPPWSKV